MNKLNNQNKVILHSIIYQLLIIKIMIIIIIIIILMILMITKYNNHIQVHLIY